MIKRIYPVLTILLLMITAYCPAQRVVDVGKEDISPLSGLFVVLGGEPISFARYVKVADGTPFFSDNWMRGTLVLSGGKKYDSVQTKIDLIADEVHYLDKAGNPLIATTPLREIWLTDSVNQKKYHFVHSSYIGSGTSASAGWHQLLADGSALLFKKISKEIQDRKPYGSATTEQHIITSGRYFILFNNKLTPVKSLSEVPDVLTAKKTVLQQYISDNRLKGKSDGDFISVVAYYNSQQTPD